jgi:hypothetical protein
MLSLLHEGIVALVREKPSLAAALLRDVLHEEVPRFSRARLAEAALTDLVPTEYRADAVVLLDAGATVFGIVVEAQLSVDPRKLYTWPLYAVTARAQHECPFMVLVVTPNDDVERWASQPVDLGGDVWRARVIGPAGIPVVTDAAWARREPHLAVLSVLAHGRDDDVATAVAIATAAVAGIAGEPEETLVLYSVLIDRSLGEAARKSFAMLPQGQQFYSEHYLEARREGEAKGKAQGKAEGLAEAVITVLEARGLRVTPDQRAQILATRDVVTLEEWVKRAVTVDAIEALFVQAG